MLAKKRVVVGLFTWMILGLFPGVVLAGEGSCVGVEFPRDPKTNKVDRAQPVKVIRQNVTVYEDASTSDPVEFLEFNESLQVLDAQGTRVKISTMASLEPLGWIERSDLLCALAPLRGESGLEKKLYIRTATEVREVTFTLTDESFTKLRDDDLPEEILIRLRELKNVQFHDKKRLVRSLELVIGNESNFEELRERILEQAELQGKASTVTAFPSPDLTECEGDTCRELSRFTGYFVFDETEDRYLLSESYRLTETEKLVGWIDKSQGIIWDTAYGVRPEEELGDAPDTEPERTVCAYKTLEDALSKKNCQPILGGNRWYLYADRIPILGRVKKQEKVFYHVAFPLAGTGAKSTSGESSDEASDKDKIVIIDPAILTGGNPGISSVLSRKHVDVFFLIDGTRSMKPYIEAVRKDVVRNIIATLQDDENFKETQFRFGFRIYRDTFAGPQELGEGYPLPTSCLLNAAEKQQNLQEFYQVLGQVEEMQETTDDYPENLFGGIRQAIRDLAACPDHTKLLFVIGDCGYDAEARKARGVSSIEMSALISKLQGSEETATTSIVTFFLQPEQSDLITHTRWQYEEAYELFTEQARDILRQVLGTGQPEVLDKYFMYTTDTDLSENVLAGVKQFSNAGVINELVLDLRGGAALVEAIERLQQTGRYKNLPGLFWDLVRQGSCEELGEQCQQRIYETILDGYIPVSDNVTEDVWLTSSDLHNWTLFLNSIGNMAGVSGSELRETFVNALLKALENVIRKPTQQDTDEPLSVFMQRQGGLPVRDSSPLFRYSINDLRDPDIVPNCELARLVTWVTNVSEILGIIGRGDQRPVYDQIPFPGECPSGLHIPFIDGPITSRSLGSDPKMRYDHQFQKAHVYWVPQEYLP